MGRSEAGVGSFSFVPAISYQPFLFVRLKDQWKILPPLHGEMAEARFLRQIGGAAGVEIKITSWFWPIYPIACWDCCLRQEQLLNGPVV